MALRVAVLERRVHGVESQLVQMVRQGTVFGLRAVEDVSLGGNDWPQPRIQIRGQTLPLEAIATEWDASQSRLVILGDPGYGKTVAALSLLAYVNGTQDRAGQSIAELFTLAEWHRWAADHTASSLSDWLADELTIAYPELPRSVAGALVDGGFVIPVLDGLDEVPEPERVTCKEAIDAYAGRTGPFRPFLLTCRAAEYAQLAPHWVAADHQVGLVGLEPNQIRALVEERTRGQPGWQSVRQELVRGSQALNKLFRSPLRLSIALQVYRNAAADSLLDLDLDAAEGQLWDLLAEQGASTFDGGRAYQVRSWLAFLANSMRREGRQRFWLHELYLYAQHRAREVRRFMRILVVSGGLFFGMAYGVTELVGRALGIPYGWDFAGALVRVIGSALIGAVVVATVVSDSNIEHVRVMRSTVSLRMRLLAVARSLPIALSIALVVGLVVGLATRQAIYPSYARGAGLMGGVAAALLYILTAALNAGRTAVPAEPPRHLGSGGPTAVLIASRNAAVSRGLVPGAAVGVMVGLALAVYVVLTFWGLPLPSALFDFVFERAVKYGLTIGLGVGLASGLIGWLLSGGHAWLYYHWLRRRLARQELLPKQLDKFLQWCAEPERAWLRISDAYEFRHREFLDHLAGEASRTPRGRAVARDDAETHA